MNNFVKYLWQLPQNLVGLIVMVVTKAKKAGNHYEFNVKYGSVSLGNYVFLCPNHWKNETVLKHEQGHQKQSEYLGWLYLLVIGLPSLIWAGCFEGYRKKRGVSYYDFYTERWANRLGGVE